MFDRQKCNVSIQLILLVSAADGAIFRKINKPGTGIIHAPKFRNSGGYTVVSHQILNSMEQTPEKLTGSQLVKKFPTIYGTRRFITAFTSAHSSPNTSGMSTDPLLI
jgi:hypothetical protein